MYGSEDMQVLLQLLTALEIACFPAWCDLALVNYQKLVGDSRIHVPVYHETLLMASKLGTATEIIHLCAASAVIGRPIEPVYPSNNQHLAWIWLQVIGRGVQQQK